MVIVDDSAGGRREQTFQLRGLNLDAGVTHQYLPSAPTGIA